MYWRRRIEPFVRPLFRLHARWRRAMTLGVRAIVTDAEGRVLLVEHTYVPGWHFPGGGVEAGQTTEQAVARELVEEAGVEVIGRPRLISVHDNRRTMRGDHVLLYRVDQWRPCQATSRNEIAEIGWFDPAALPDGATPATRRRLAEAQGAEFSEMW